MPPPAKRRRDANATIFGLGPDDSLNSFSDNTEEIQSPEKDDSSYEDLLPPIVSTTHEWFESSYVPPFNYSQEDFARVRYLIYTPPLLIRFYKGKNGARGQIGELENILMTELVSCYTQQMLTSNNIILIIENIDSTTFPFYEEGLIRILSHLSTGCSGIRKCILWMDSYYQAKMLASILSKHCNKLFELNIGAPRREDLPKPHPPPAYDDESNGVVSLLEIWLQSTLDTIRCLRIYTFLEFHKNFESMVNSCVKLNHLTISKVFKCECTLEFPSILSVELDKQKLGYTDMNLKLLKKLPLMFPNASKIKLVGNQYNPLTEFLLKSLGSIKNRKFDVFQYDIPFKDQISKFCKRTALLYAKSEVSSGSILIKNQRYNNSIAVHDGNYTYHSKL